MAAEIPVYVDIMTGIDDAIKNQLPKAIKSMKMAVSRNALQLKFHVDDKSLRSVRDILSDATLNAEQLATALAEVQAQIDKKTAGGAFKGKISRKDQALLEVKDALTARRDLLLEVEKVDKRTSSQTVESQKKVKRSVEETNSAVTKTTDGFERMGRSLKGIVSNAIKLYALHAAVRFIKNVRAVTSEFELQRVALGSIIQDTERAEALFRQIKAAAIKSPFEIKDLVTYTKQLAAYQIETEKLFDVTMKLADVSAGLGVDMNRLVLAYGQVRAASVLRGQELRQFTEAGIPLVDKLAQKFRELGREGTTTADVFQLISERAVPFRMIEEIFNDMTDAGGMFYKMQEKQAQTLAGQWANLKDSLSIMYDEIGRTEAVHGAIESLIKATRHMAQNWRLWANAIQAVSAALIVNVGYQKLSALVAATLVKLEKASVAAESMREKSVKKLITAIIGKTAAEKISTKAMHLSSAATFKAAFATNTLKKAFWQLTMVMLNNPFGIIASLVAGLVTLFASLSNRMKDVGEEVDAANASIQAFKKTRDETSRLIDQYEELSKKESLTTEETKKLKDISEELAKTFPKASEGIDENTKALSLNIKNLRKYNKLAQEANEKGLRAQMRVEERQVRQNEREINKLSRRIVRGTGGYSPIAGFAGFLLPLTNKQTAEYNKQITKLVTDNEALAASIKSIRDALDGVEASGGAAAKETTLWQDKMIEFNSRTNKEGFALQILSPDQIKGYSKLEDVLDVLAQKYEEQTKDIAKLEKAKEVKNEAEAAEIERALELRRGQQALTFEMLQYWHALDLIQKKNAGQTPWYESYLGKRRDWVKFMKDFKSGYDKLKKYLGQGAALSTEAAAMLTRGTAMGLSPETQKKAAENLLGWYKKTREEVFAKVQQQYGKAGYLSSLELFLGAEIKGTKDRAKALRAFQAFLQSLYDAETDLNTSNLELQLESDLNDIKEKLKRSETAQNFYEDILGLTGDKELATKLTVQVYGEDVAKDFKERMQEAFAGALNLPDQQIDEGLKNTLADAILGFNLDVIKEHLDELPPKVKEMFEQLLQSNEAYASEYLKNFEKTYAKAKTFEQRIQAENNKRSTEIEKARAAGKSDAEIAAINEYFDRQVANIQLEALKGNYEWTKAFEDLDGVSTQTLTKLVSLIDTYVEKYYKDLDPVQQKELVRARENIRAQLLVRDSYAGAIEARERLADSMGRIFGLTVAGKKGTAEYTKAVDDEVRALKDLADAHQNMLGDIEKLTNSAKELVQTFASAGDASFFSEQVDNGMKALSGVVMAGASLAKVLTGTASPQDYINLLTSLSDIITGVFDAKHAADIRRINEEIDAQTDALDRLRYTYDRLGVAMERAFGSDYIEAYTKQLDALERQQTAYLEQARLEREKGKKADDEKIKEYENSAQEVADRIADTQNALSEHFAGTDLTSAARDFAKAWIDAYREFGNTADAISEKFRDMIENMVTESLAAKLVETQLRPIFDEIDSMSKEGGQLSVEDIAKIANMTKSAAAALDSNLANLFNALSGAGLNVRQMGTGLTGIARDIQGASEESILGLAAGINTQNYYMSQINANVLAILNFMTGTSSTGSAAGETPGGSLFSPFQTQALTHMNSIDNNIAEIKSLLQDVIKPNGAPAPRYVATR